MRRPLCAPQAVEQQPAIARIDQRMYASDSIAELPVKKAAVNLVDAISRLPASAA